MSRLICLLPCVALLAACSSHPTPASATAAASTPASATTNALAGTPMAAYGTDLNRAKNVQNIVNAQAKKQAAAISAATGSSSSH